MTKINKLRNPETPENPEALFPDDPVPPGGPVPPDGSVPSMLLEKIAYRICTSEISNLLISDESNDQLLGLHFEFRNRVNGSYLEDINIHQLYYIPENASEYGIGFRLHPDPENPQDDEIFV